MDQAEHFIGEAWRNYRDTAAVPEAGANFMPELWRRIEARSFGFRVKRMSQVVVASTAILCALFMGLMVLPGQSGPAETYVDALAATHPTENLLAQGISR